MNLAEIKNRRRTGNKRDGWLIKDADYQWLIAEVERLTTAYVDTRTERDHLSAQVGILQSALTHAKAEGRREGLEEAAKIADCYVLGEDVDGKDVLATEVAAAIRQQAVQG